MRSTFAALAGLLATLLLVPAAQAHDAFPCGRRQRVAWTAHRVQKCDLGHPLAHGRIPVYAHPVAHRRGPAPRARGHLQGTANQYFVCQRRFAGAEYRYPGRSWRNDWWAYTKSDDHHWGWVPEVFFRGGANDEADGGLHRCGTHGPGAPRHRKHRRRHRRIRCTTYAILGLRGSGEAYAGPYHMGATVGPTAYVAAAALRGGGRSVSAYSIPYPAVGVSVATLENSGPGGFFWSMDLGTLLLEQRIAATARRCPHTRMGVIGYSQGAGAASEALRHLSAATLHHVRGVLLYADTFSAGNTGYALTIDVRHPRRRAHRIGVGIFGKRRLPRALPHKIDVCFVQDPVCDLPHDTGGRLVGLMLAGIHTHYKDYVGGYFGSLTAFAGRLTATMMRR